MRRSITVYIAIFSGGFRPNSPTAALACTEKCTESLETALKGGIYGPHFPGKTPGFRTKGMTSKSCASASSAIRPLFSRVLRNKKRDR